MSPAHEAYQRQIEALRRAFGPKLMGYFSDRTVVEIMVNPDGGLWIERAGHGMTREGDVSATQATAIINTAAALVGAVVNADAPVLECELPNGGSEFGGARMEALVPPAVAAPAFAVRKKAEMVFTLDDYVARGIMSAAQRQAIVKAVEARRNILIAGGTGTGKTTLANAVLDAVARHDRQSRIVVIEDTQELQCTASNVVFLRTTINVDQTQLLRATMRLRPDRIVVGEVRDKSALALLKAWNTGHPGGVGTVHANDARAALIRVGQLIQEAGVPPAPELIAEAVNVVVSIRRISGHPGRMIDEVVAVRGYSNGQFVTEVL